MKATFELNKKSFFFMGPLSLQRGGEPVTLDLTQYDDGFLRCVAINTAAQILKSDVEPVDMAKLIRDQLFRDETYVALGLSPDVKGGEFKDTIQVKAEIVDEEAEEVAEAVVASQAAAEESVEEESDFSSLDVSDESLQKLLKGSNDSVINKIEQASLAQVDKERLIKLEKEGKNRKAIIAVIEKL